MTMRRLTLMGLLLLALLAMPRSVGAQQARGYRIGVVHQGGSYSEAIDSSDLTAKRLELLKGMTPRTRRVLALYNPDNPVAQRSAKLAREAARQLKVELVERPVASVEELRAALHALRPGEVDAIAYVADAMVTSQAELVIETARAKRLPTNFQDKETALNGSLASYAENYYTIGRRSAKHVQQVLRGANPGDLPVEQLDRFHFVVNLKTAKALGLTIPQSVLARADEIIP